MSTGYRWGYLKMNVKTAILVFLVFSVFLVGCKSSQTGYASYNQPQGQQQQNGQYVGGGCGVAPSGDYKDTPINELGLTNSAL